MTPETQENLSGYLPEGGALDPAVLADLFAMSELIEAIQLRIRELAEATGMPSLHFFVLERLAIHGGAAPLGALLTELNVPKQSGTYIIDQLERGGHVERQRDPADRRRLRVALTEVGTHHVRTHLEPFYTAMTTALETVPSKQRTQVIDSLARFRRAL